MFSRSGYQALPLGDFDRFQQSSIGLYGAQKGFFSFGSKPDPLGPAGNAADSSQGWLSWICHGIITSLVFLLMILTFPISGWFALKVVPTYERMVIFRLGRLRAPQGPGVVLLLPFIDHWQRVDLRTRAFNVPPCKLISRDGAVLSMGADVQFRVWDPALSVLAVKDLVAATRMTAQSAMAKALGKKSLREIQGERLRIGEQLLLEINDTTKSWGLEVDRVELTMEAVLQPPRESPPGALPPVLEGPALQPAAHLYGSTVDPAGSVPSTPGTADSTGAAGSADPPRGRLSVAELLSAVEPLLSEALVSRVGASYQLDIALPGGIHNTCFIDLSSGSGRAGHGVPQGSPDVVLEVAEEDLHELLLGELRPLAAYRSGRLRVQGDLHLALRLEELFKAVKLHR
ncbi:STML1 protein, partial [Penelope pileata]|nr:STML1 protein [Penelope pileata]